MALSFPSSPTLNQTYTVGTKTWIWNGYAWDLQLATGFSSANGAIAWNTANAAFAKANTGGPGGSSANGFGVIYTANNNTFANAATANAQLNFVGEAGVYVYANATTKTITVASTPGAQGLTVDYGYVYDSIYYAVDYGTL